MQKTASKFLSCVRHFGVPILLAPLFLMEACTGYGVYTGGTGTASPAVASAVGSTVSTGVPSGGSLLSGAVGVTGSSSSITLTPEEVTGGVLVEASASDGGTSFTFSLSPQVTGVSLQTNATEALVTSEVAASVTLLCTEVGSGATAQVSMTFGSSGATTGLPTTGSSSGEVILSASPGPVVAAGTTVVVTAAAVDGGLSFAYGLAAAAPTGVVGTVTASNKVTFTSTAASTGTLTLVAEETTTGQLGEIMITFGTGGTTGACATQPDPTGAINNLYLFLLGRAADSGGLAAFTSQIAQGVPVIGSGTGDVVDQLYDSEECQANGAYNGVRVIALYQSILCRNPADSEIQAWVNQMNQGLSYAGVVSGILTSAEHTSNPATCGDPINRSYEEILNRVADSAGLSYYQGQLTSGGMDIFQVQTSLRQSTEYQENGGLYMEQISALYRVLLGRFADSAGLQSYVAMMGAGEPLTSIAASILASSEYETRSCQ